MRETAKRAGTRKPFASELYTVMGLCAPIGDTAMFIVLNRSLGHFTILFDRSDPCLLRIYRDA